MNTVKETLADKRIRNDKGCPPWLTMGGQSFLLCRIGFYVIGKAKNLVTLHIFNKIMVTLFTLIRYSILVIKKN